MKLSEYAFKLLQLAAKEGDLEVVMPPEGSDSSMAFTRSLRLPEKVEVRILTPRDLQHRYRDKYVRSWEADCGMKGTGEKVWLLS